MTEIGLTQEQIDAMLGGGGGGDAAAAGGPSSDDLATLADFERETMGNMPSVLNAMTGAEYELAGVEFAKTNPGELADLAGSDLIFSIPIEVDGPMTHLLMLEAGFSKEVAAALTGGEPGEDPELNEMELSAIQEVVSQANGTYLTNLGAALKKSVAGESISKVDADAAAQLIDDTALIGTMTISRGEAGSAQIRHIIPGALADMILGELGTSAAPEPAPAAAPAAAPQATPPAAAPAPAPQPDPVSAALPTESIAAPAVSSGSVMGPATEFQPATFSQLTEPMDPVDTRNLDILLDVPLEVTVELGKTRIPIRQILEYCQGSLITLDKLAGEPIDLLVNGKYFAKGEVVVIDENFGVRITSILSPAERIAQLS